MYVVKSLIYVFVIMMSCISRNSVGEFKRIMVLIRNRKSSFKNVVGSSSTTCTVFEFCTKVLNRLKDLVIDACMRFTGKAQAFYAYEFFWDCCANN